MALLLLYRGGGGGGERNNKQRDTQLVTYVCECVSVPRSKKTAKIHKFKGQNHAIVIKMKSFVFAFFLSSSLLALVSCSSPPTSELVSFSKSFRHGSEVRLICNGESDQSMKFDWFFNDRPLKSEKEIKIFEFSKESSALVISNSENKHSGSYSCKVTNSFGQSSSHLKVDIEGKTID